jgi:hypothetical protein
MEGVAWSAQRIPPAVKLGFLDRNSYFSIQVAPQLSLRGWVDPVPDPLLLRKSGSAGNRTRDPWICSQELWPLDHRGGLNWRFYKLKLTCPYIPYVSVHNQQRCRTSLSSLTLNTTKRTYDPPKAYTVAWFLYPNHYKGPFITALFRSPFLFLPFLLFPATHLLLPLTVSGGTTRTCMTVT